jgi:2-C-methyl-D-erythritol 4-phosphate cytidylyltransferase
MPASEVGVVIVAADRNGRRDESNSLLGGGKPMLLHSVQAFHARRDVAMVVCAAEAFVSDPPPWLFQCDIDRLLISVGGRERTESVATGSRTARRSEGRARPRCRAAVREQCDDRSGDRGSAMRAVAALPVVDTLKEVDEKGRGVRTVARERLWRAQTPQGFPRDLIEEAHARARAERTTATDDAALFERLGLPVVVVRGSERAMKITDEDDFARADALFPVAE